MSVRYYSSIHHHDILKGGLGAMPSGVYPVGLCINVPCVSLEWHGLVGFQKQLCMDASERARGGFPPLV